jgi:ubiquinol-cytochrome c reductase core subunit 2
MGSQTYSSRSRENLVVGAKFLRDDLPYFVELLAEVATQTKYAPHVYHEEIYPHIQLAQKHFLGDVLEMAVNSAHGLAFHRGLGVPTSPSSSTPLSKYLDADAVADFAESAYAAPNFAIVANGVESGELSKWVGQFFNNIPSTPRTNISSPKSQYFGGEERIAHGSGNAMVLAFPGSSTPAGDNYKPEIAVLAALLGGQSTIKWSPGFSLLSKASSKFQGANVETKSAIYSDAGLLSVSIKGSAKDVKGAAQEVVNALKQVASGVSKEDFTKAKAAAKFKELEFGQNIDAGIELTGASLVQGNKAYQIDEVAKGIDSVTEEQLKEVSYVDLFLHATSANYISRLPRLSSRARLQCHRSVTFTYSLTLRSSASRCKYDLGKQMQQNVPLNLYSRFCVDLQFFRLFIKEPFSSFIFATSVDNMLIEFDETERGTGSVKEGTSREVAVWSGMPSLLEGTFLKP